MACNTCWAIIIPQAPCSTLHKHFILSSSALRTPIHLAECLTPLNFMRELPQLSPVYRWGNWGAQRESHSTKSWQLAVGRTGIWTHMVCTPNNFMVCIHNVSLTLMGSVLGGVWASQRRGAHWDRCSLGGLEGGGGVCQVFPWGIAKLFETVPGRALNLLKPFTTNSIF